MFVSWLISMPASAGFSVLVTTRRAKPSLDSLIEKELPALVAACQLLHAAPELSGQKEKTSAYLAAQLKALGYDVTEGIGK
jgi:hippurate hydrolase